MTMAPDLPATLTRTQLHPYSQLIKDWDFVPTPNAYLSARRALRMMYRLRRAPRTEVLVPVTQRPAWAAYFVYAPQEQLLPNHLFTLGRLRDMGLSILVVCATARRGVVPDGLRAYADALLWKDLPGYDFSAYAFALHELARHSPGANVMILNDSVFGPFSDLRPHVLHSRWDLQGFTASSTGENHIQSYAFVVSRLDSERLQHLGAPFSDRIAYTRAGDVILCQELRFARLASLRMKVGSAWYSDGMQVSDPMLMRPVELCREGFPFVKKSLMGKFACFQPEGRIRDLLAEFGHPTEG
jgi:lipopolysaccharide biosynthesis protein